MLSARFNIYARLLVATATLLLIPLVAMLFTAEVDWSAVDFAAMGALIFGVSSLCAFTLGRTRKKYRFAVISLFVFAFLYFWAELAVGVFTSLGS